MPAAVGVSVRRYHNRGAQFAVVPGAGGQRGDGVDGAPANRVRKVRRGVLGVLAVERGRQFHAGGVVDRFSCQAAELDAAQLLVAAALFDETYDAVVALQVVVLLGAAVGHKDDLVVDEGIPHCRQVRSAVGADGCQRDGVACGQQLGHFRGVHRDVGTLGAPTSPVGVHGGPGG